MNAGTFAGAMPAKVSVRARAMVTAGLAKLVEEVNQYAALIQSATAAAISCLVARDNRRIKSTRPKVATASPSHSPAVARFTSSGLQQGQSKHGVREKCSETGADNLRREIANNRARRENVVEG